MDNLVFLDPNTIETDPFTTSKVIAEHGKVSHKATQQLIRTHEETLREFGRVEFEMRPLKTRGGIQNEVIYHLNEQQATLLITFMKNTTPVVRFKKTLVKQFYIMQKELQSRKITRELGKRAREALTNSIQGLPDSPHKAMKYKHYTDLIYKIVFGKTAKQLREDYGITDKDNLRNYFQSTELDKLDKLENQVSVLIELGYDYQTIKGELQKKYVEVA